MNKKLKKFVSENPSNWKEIAIERVNKPWLREYSSQIARRILAALEDNPELNQSKLGSLLNVTPQQISKIVKGQENLTLETVYKISNALNTELITFPPYKYSVPIAENEWFAMQGTNQSFGSKGHKVIHGQARFTLEKGNVDYTNTYLALA